MQRVTREGVTLAYEEAGSGAPPLLLVHGLTHNHTYLQPQFEHFSRQGHYHQLEVPEQVNAMIERFIAIAVTSATNARASVTAPA